MREAFAFISLLIFGSAGTVCSQAPSWWEMKSVVLSISPDNGPEVAWTLDVFDEGDVRILQEVQDNPKYNGEMMVLGGRYLLSRGIELTPGMEIDAVDVPGLHVQLLNHLLTSAMPDGPSAVRERTAVSHMESEDPIKVHTTSAGGEYKPPWSVEGFLSEGADGSILFDLVFEFSPGPRVFGLKGSWSGSSPGVRIEEDTSIVGWSLFTLGPVKHERDGSTMLDYGASPIPEKPNTVGELRTLSEKKP